MKRPGCFAARVSIFLFLLAPLSVLARGGGGCFLPGTPIRMADGSSRPIEDVSSGDRILALETGDRVVPAKVRAVFIHDVEEYCILTTDRTVLRVTPEHPFCVSDGEFVQLSDLRAGSILSGLDGHKLRPEAILGIERVRVPTGVYNLETDAPHT